MATTATISKKNLWGGGVEPLKASYGKLMMWFFLLSDAFTFSGLLITYAFLRWSAPAYKGDPDAFTFSTEYWPIPEKVYEAFPGFHGVELPLVFVGLMTFILILSSVTMVLAVEAGHRMDKKGVVKWMLWTIIGGFAFLSCQAWEWSHFIAGTDTATIGDVVINGVWKENYEIFGANLTYNQYGPPAFAALFFFITGFHGFHVFSGVVLNVIIFFNAANGLYERRGHYEMVEKVGLYWHFVDLVWVFVFTFFYLI
ncbi:MULTISPECIES: cytochrome c oxidase subunit 3 [Roseivirga]|jgi:cytochrome c oxidase subunit 3|uniref:Bb3-type cytochrome oxidase subunit IV n=1 Tax=Roseivirga thermotolerans TaxID=1758176 RepID=A0ABQ3I9U1_9BACT|nr:MULTISPECIES: cytochrome c oxidase subunit 3 [Roseivirga]MEC7752392.1 cytochrome c oxidase subunit 3 [Bacteroidota bacterium]GHE67888.1 bb3-type cytochrome oxidase subunit IV [Roseivirga thermotolerans]|tara:strand:- start:2529 stop:3293 length:765 start_codon:yes stop_codon:yes gene_type:complete